MASGEQWGYYRGVLLPSIAEALGVPDGDRKEAAEHIHGIFKELFEVESIRSFSEEDMQWFLSYIHMLFAREFGVMLPLPKEPDVILLNRMGMRPFLNYELSKELNEKLANIGK